MLTDKEKLEKIIKEFCHGQRAALAKILDVSPQTINNWLNRSISKEGIGLIESKFPQIRSSWLISGEGDMFKDNHAPVKTFVGVNTGQFNQEGAHDNFNGCGNAAVLHERIRHLEEENSQLKSRLDEKDERISELKERINELKQNQTT